MPTSEECEEYQTFISSSSSTSQDIDSEISKLAETIELLRLRRVQLERHVENRKRVLNPIRKLPTEVLQKIFSYALPGHSSWTSFRKVSIHNTFDPHEDDVWKLSYVSRRWRAIILNTPSLWSSLSIAVNGPTTLSRSIWTRFLSLQLHRSGNHPLYVVLVEYPNDPTTGLPPGVLDLLLPSTSRWQKLMIRVGNTSLAPISDLFTDLCSLNWLFFDLSGYTELGSLNLSSLRAVRQLYGSLTHSLHITCPPQLVVALPEAQLLPQTRSFASARVSSSLDCLVVLAKAPKLEECRFALASNIIPWPVRVAIRMPHSTLRILRLRESTGTHGEMCNLINAISAPGLRELELNGKITLSAVAELIQRSQCTLEVLHLTGGPVTEDSLSTSDVSTLSEHLRTLYLGMSGRQMLKVLEHVNEEDMPRLTALGISTHKVSAQTISKVEEVLEMLKTVSWLRELIIS